VLSSPVRRRLDNVLLRWQARLDSPWADRVLPWAASGAFFVVLALLSLARARSLDSPTQLAVAVQQVWALGDGNADVSLLDGVSALAPRFSVLLIPLAALSRAFPMVPLLLVVQAAALSLAVVPLWRLARVVASLRPGASATLAFAYCCYPAVHGVNLSGFHVESFAVPALLLGALAGFTDRRALLYGCVAVTLAARADLGLAVVGLGLVLTLNDREATGRRCLLIGALWTVAGVFVLQPLLGGNEAAVVGLEEYGRTTYDVLWHVVTNPWQVVGDLVAEPNLDLLVLLLGPLLFLPILVPRFAVGALPSASVALLAARPADDPWSGAVIPLIAFSLLATTFALRRLGRTGVERVNVDRRILFAMVLASLAFFAQSAAASPYLEPWTWGGRQQADLARLEVSESIQADDRVRAEPRSLLLLAERPTLLVLDPEVEGDARAMADDVDAIVLDTEQLSAAGWTPTQVVDLLAGLETRAFVVVVDRDGIILLRRDALAPADD